MGLLDIFSGGNQDPAAQQPGLLAPGAGGGGTNWQNILATIAAAMKDTGAYMQHDPGAATNVAELHAARQRASDQAHYLNMLAALARLPAARMLPVNGVAGPQIPPGSAPPVQTVQQNPGWMVQRIA